MKLLKVLNMFLKILMILKMLRILIVVIEDTQYIVEDIYGIENVEDIN